MKNKKAIVLMWVIALLPAVLVFLAMPHLPERVPIHWGLSGEADSWGSPATLWLLAAAGPLMAALFQFLPRLDPKRENYGKFQGLYDLFGVLMPTLELVVMCLTLSEALQPGKLPIGKAITILVGLLLMVVGNMMGKLKPNWFMGIRTPWTLSDPDVWNRTHRLGGWVFFLSGMAAVILALLAPMEVCFTVLMILILGGAALTYIMSWKWYKDKDRED